MSVVACPEPRLWLRRLNRHQKLILIVCLMRLLIFELWMLAVSMKRALRWLCGELRCFLFCAHAELILFIIVKIAISKAEILKYGFIVFVVG